MIQPACKLAWATSGLGLVFGLGLSGAIAQTIPQPIPMESNFLNWLRNPDEEEPPNSPRPLESFCLVTLAPGAANPLWRDRPTFILQGSPRSLALYREDATEPFWTYPVNEAEAVTYSGPPLVPGVTYTLRAEHPVFPASQYEERELKLIGVEEQVNVALALSNQAAEMQQAGQSEAAIAIAHADYLWRQGFETDAWAAVWPLQDESSVVDEAIATGIEQRCE